jgi:hypothetical protein
VNSDSLDKSSNKLSIIKEISQEEVIIVQILLRARSVEDY